MEFGARMPKPEISNTRRKNLTLSGVRVADFSRLLPGPWAAQLLGDLGADIIKVEQPRTGDPSRHNAPFYRDSSAYFESVNGNKRSIQLDLAKPDDLEIARRLIAWADVMIISYRPGVSESLSLDYEAARTIKSDLIYCSITGFGHTGSLSAIPGHDLVVQAASGLMGGTLQDGLPHVPAFQAADYAAASTAAIGILAALYRCRDTGEGCFLDLSMFDSLLAMSQIVMTGALSRSTGRDVSDLMEIWGKNPRYSTYKTKDGKAVAVALLEKRLWASFCQTIDRPDLINANEDVRDRTSGHKDHAERYRQVISDICLSHTRDELVAMMRKKNIPILPINTPDEGLIQDHARERGMIEWTEHPTEGRIGQIESPLKRAGLTRPRSPAPALDADREQILKELGIVSVSE
jgi:crotonobetainyl-CoA:carnitine CoA-transferase CaiB-like acyl-CoA transferase